MEILLFHPWLKSRGGAERLVYEYQKRSKNNITILAWNYIRNKTFDFDNVIYVFGERYEKLFRGYLIRGGFSLITNLIKLPKDIEKNYDLFLISSGGIGELILLRNNLKIPKVIYSHTILRASYSWDILWNLKYRFNKLYILPYKIALSTYNNLERKVWRKIDFAIFNSELSKKRALDKKLIDESKTYVINPGADLNNFYNKEPEDYFLYVARIGLAKRQHLLIKAFAKLHKKYPGYKLYLVGSLENKKYYYKLLKLIKLYKLEKDVKIFLNVDDKTLR
ncbi:MAG: glycosyltransferase, partial [Nanopusillaceae archaeon]